MTNDDANNPAGSADPKVFKKLGLITRQLHDTLNELGVMPKLQQSAQGLSDARSRLNYIAEKTGASAERVLNSVDQAKIEHASIVDATQRLTRLGSGGAQQQPALAAAMEMAVEIEAAAIRIDNHLTDIMMAQDFHDLTGQVVAKVVALAIDLEDSLVKLLIQAAPVELSSHPLHSDLSGPVVDPEGRTDVVSSQGEVDDLLASLGF